MSDVNRRIVIQGDASGFERAVDSSANSASNSFERVGEKVNGLFQETTAHNERTNDTLKNQVHLLREIVSLKERLSLMDKLGIKPPQEPEKKPAEDEDGVSGGGGGISRPKNNNQQNNQQQGGGMRSRLTNVGRTSLFSFGGSIGLASLFSIGGAIAKLIGEGKQLDERVGGLGGIMESKGAAQKEVNTFALGMKQSDLFEYNKIFAQQRGSTDDLFERSTQQLAFEKSFGINAGALSPNNQLMRAEEGENRTAADVATEMLNLFRRSDLFNIGKDDFSLLEEKLGFQAELTQKQATQMEGVNSTISARLLDAFGKVGGSFGDFRQTSQIEKINQSITNPNSDFERAFIFRALRRQNPDKSLFDLMKQQEKGVFGEGNLSAILQDLTETFSGEALKFNVSSLLGLNKDSSERLLESYESDPKFRDDLDNLNNREDIEKYFTNDSIRERGESNIGTVSRVMSEFDTKAGQQGIKAIKKFDRDYADKILDGDVMGVVGQVIRDVTGAIKDGFTSFFGDFHNNMDKMTSGLFGGFKEQIESVGQNIGQTVANIVYGDPEQNSKEKWEQKNRMASAFISNPTGDEIFDNSLKDIKELDPFSGGDYNSKLNEFVVERLYKINVTDKIDMEKQDKNKDGKITEDEMTENQLNSQRAISRMKEGMLELLLTRIVELLERNPSMTPKQAFNRVYSVK